MKIIRISGIKKSFTVGGTPSWTVTYDFCGEPESLISMMNGKWKICKGEISDISRVRAKPSLQINQLYVMEPIKSHPLFEHLRRLTFFEKRRLPAVAKELLANTL
jgi:hypothetical protein